MNYNIRPYNHSDFSEIVSWWTHYGEPAPLEGMMTPNGSFVLELDGVSALTQTVLLTQSKELCYLEGFCKNPEFRNVSLESYIAPLWDEVFNYAKARGYKRILGYCKVPSLEKKYERLGLVKAGSQMSVFTKEF